MKAIALLRVATLIAAFSCAFVGAEAPRSTGHRVIPPKDLKEVPGGEPSPAKPPRIVFDEGMRVVVDKDKPGPDEALPGPHEEKKKKADVVRAEDGAVTAALNPEFATDLYAQLRVSQGNVFFSPHSITEAMAMAYLGSREDTAKEIATAMSFKLEPQENAGAMSNLRDSILAHSNKGENRFRIANALCVTGATPDAAYLKQIGKSFDAKAFEGDLAEINGWVKQKTEGNIDKILSELSPDSACVLLNAVYFKGGWKSAFDPKDTREGEFHVSADKVVRVPFMSRTGDFAFAYDDGWWAVELPYTNSCSMVLLLPRKADGLAALEAGLDEAFVANVCKKLKDGGLDEVRVRLPKFKIATEYDLKPVLGAMGLQKAFELEQANFEAMYSNRKAAIGQIVHKAALEVDEKGSVAAAATAAEVLKESAPMGVSFDRPFLVMIRENNTSSTLFMGRISDPTK